MTLDAPDPVVAQKALERALAHFQDLYIKIHVSDATPELFLRRKEAAEVALKTAEGNLQQFMSANFITSMEHQKNLLLERRDQLKKDLTDARSAVLGSTAKVAVIEQSLSREPERIMQSQGTRANPVVEEFKKKLAELKTQEQGLAIKFKDDVPQLKDVRAQIKELEAALRAEPASTNETIHAPNPAHQALRASLATERAILSEQQERQKEFEDELLKAEAELARLTALEPQLAQLQREVEVAKASFNNEVASYQRAQSSADLDREKVSNVSVVTAATLPVEPIKPRKKLNLVLGVMLGLFGGVAFAFVMEYLDQSIKTTEDVEKHLGLPVLATVTEKEFKKCI
ncbi:hypothetical protein HS125_08195 [bacterium]|nr:hypothetical protein [bacterium]